HLTLDNPIRAIRDVSHDMTGQRRVRLANGREASALDIQREYMTKARDFTDRRGADATTKRVLDLWERALSAIEIGNLDLVAREIDWVTKYQLNEQAQRTVLCKDPFRSVDERVEKLIAGM